MKRASLYLLLIFTTASLTVCKKKQFTVTISTGEQIRSVFSVPAQKPQLTLEEGREVFQKLGENAGRICPALNKGKSPLQMNAGELKGIFTDQAAADPALIKKAMGKAGLKAASMLGCQSYYALTDPAVSADFKKAAAVSKQFDCYAVGLSQPWIMAGSGLCRSLSMVDINFRTLDFHAYMLQALQAAAKSGQGADIDGLVKGYTFNWPADIPKEGVVKAEGVAAGYSFTVDALCGDEAAACRAGFNHVYEEIKAGRMAPVVLHWTSLHQLKLPAAETAVLFYTSNALDATFTDKNDYEAMLTNLATAHVIYHQSGNKAFGLYRLEKQKVSAVCSDHFKTKGAKYFDLSVCQLVTKKPEPYLNWLDRSAGLSLDKKNTCSL